MNHEWTGSPWSSSELEIDLPSEFDDPSAEHIGRREICRSEPIVDGEDGGGVEYVIYIHPWRELDPSHHHYFAQADVELAVAFLLHRARSDETAERCGLVTGARRCRARREVASERRGYIRVGR